MQNIAIGTKTNNGKALWLFLLQHLITFTLTLNGVQQKSLLILETKYTLKQRGFLTQYKVTEKKN